IRLGSFLLMMGGRQRLPYTHVTNCARAVVLAGEVPGIEGQAFNVVDDELPTGRQLVKRYRREVGPVRKMAIPRWAIPPLSGLCASLAESDNCPVAGTMICKGIDWNAEPGSIALHREEHR